MILCQTIVSNSFNSSVIGLNLWFGDNLGIMAQPWLQNPGFI